MIMEKDNDCREWGNERESRGVEGCVYKRIIPVAWRMSEHASRLPALPNKGEQIERVSHGKILLQR